MMELKEHGKLMLVTLGWFATGASILCGSICIYRYLTGMFQ